MNNGDYFVRGKADLHLHSTVSDGTDTPEELLNKVRKAGIAFFSVTDHDAVKAGDAILPLLGERDPVFIRGAEFSCRDGDGKYHILGYRFDPESDAVKNLVTRARTIRMNKVASRLELLKKEFGFDFPGNELTRLTSLDNPGKPHIANLMVKYGYAGTKEIAIRDYINRLRVRTEYIGPAEAIDAIVAGGGIPVLAHPFYGSGDELILGEDMILRLRRLCGYGLRGLEACYSGFPGKLRNEAISLADRFGLFVTAGSDYHGSNKTVELGDTGLAPDGKNPDGLARFLEAAVGGR